MASGSIDSIKAKLLSRSPTEIPLTPKSAWDPSLQKQIESLKLQKGSRGKADILKAAMHLCNDDIENAHDLAQAHEENMTANLCHAILHRREQDYWNSKWWLSRIKHPLLSNVYNGVADAKRFVDDVDRAETASTDSASLLELQEKQCNELRALLEYAINEAES